MIQITDLLKIFWIVLKNFKLVIRSWSSLGVIVIGPLALMLLLGFSFSSTGLHDIKIGLYNENADSDYILGNVSYGEIINYPGLDECRNGIKTDDLDVCMHMRDELMSSNGTKIMIVLYYDNSKKISSFLIPLLETTITQSAKRITMGAVDEAADSFENIYDYIESSETELNDYISKIESFKTDIKKIRDELSDSKSAFSNSFNRLNSIKNTISDTINFGPKLIRENTYQIKNSINAIDNAINSAGSKINNAVIFLDENQTEIKNDFLDAKRDIGSIFPAIENIKERLSAIGEDSDLIEENLNEMTANINSITSSLEKIEDSLDLDIKSIDKIIAGLEKTISNAKKLKEDFSYMKGRLGNDDIENMKSLADPVTTKFEPLLQNLSSVYFLFPTVLVMIIVFVSMLLSNIITLNEMHSPAYLRNFTVPLRGYVFDIGLFVTSALISLFQIAVLLAFSQYNLGLPIMPIINEIAPVVILTIAVFTIIGMDIAYLIRRQHTSILVAAIFCIGAFIFSNTLLPLKFMPKIAAEIASMNPIVIASEMIRKTIFLNTSIFMEPFQLCIIIFFLVAGVILLPFAKKIDKIRIG